MVKINANDIQHQITIEEMFELLNHLGAEPRYEEDYIVCKTICHGGDSHKLYYYDNSKRFTCYTGNCGSGFSIYDLLQWHLGVDFFKSYLFVKDFLGIESSEGFTTPSERLDFSFFNKFTDKDIDNSLPTYDKKILNHFNKLYHHSWVEDNISCDTMELFDIRFNIADNQIIIPHYDIEDNLCGVRVRNLKQEVLDRGMKYMPLYYHQQSYRHSLGNNLYGIHITKPSIETNHRIILFEGEKSVMQLQNYWGDNNIGVAISGSNVSDNQIDLIHSLNVSEVIIALDKEYHSINTEEEFTYAKKIKEKIIDKLLPFYRVSVVWDREDLLDFKDSPTDKGLDTWNILFNKRIMLGGC